MAEKDTQKKPGFFSRMARSFRDMKGELKKVVWPSKKQIFNNTLIVLAFVAICAVFIGVLDYALTALVQWLL